MKKWKILSVFFFLLSFGAVKETVRIMTSSDPDIIESSISLKITAFVITGFFLYLAIMFWNKSPKK